MLKDVPPFVTASGSPAKPYGVNAEGLKRRGYSAEAITGIKRAYKTLYKSKLMLDEARREIESQTRACPDLELLAEFLKHSTRGIIR